MFSSTIHQPSTYHHKVNHSSPTHGKPPVARFFLASTERHAFADDGQNAQVLHEIRTGFLTAGRCSNGQPWVHHQSIELDYGDYGDWSAMNETCFAWLNFRIIHTSLIYMLIQFMFYHVLPSINPYTTNYYNLTNTSSSFPNSWTSLNHQFTSL